MTAKTSIILVITLSLTISASITAQERVTVTPYEVTYTRTASNARDSAKTIRITYPKISGIDNDVQIFEIEKAISYWPIFETTLAEELENDFFKEVGYSYKVNYNNKGILEVQLTNSFYLNENEKTIVVDLESSSRVKIEEVFRNRTELYQKINEAHMKEFDAAVARLNPGSSEDDQMIMTMLEDTKQNRSVFDIDEFSVNDQGVTFIFKYAVDASRPVSAPAGRYFFSWSDLRPFVTEYGVFSMFYR